MNTTTRTERIHSLKEALDVNWSELGRLAGRSRQAVNSWRTGGTISGEAAILLQERANVNPNWLLYGKGRMFLTSDSAARKAEALVANLPPEDQDRALAMLQAVFQNSTKS